MKLKKLNIESYRHLQDLKFDFTYPHGHIKEGKPLEKICLIGQSATGKTSILELIKNNLAKLVKTEIINGKYFWHYFDLDFKGEVEYITLTGNLLAKNDLVVVNDYVIENFPGNSIAGTVGNLLTDTLKLLYLSSELISKETIGIFNQNPINIIDSFSKDQDYKISKTQTDSTYIYEFVQDISADIWFRLLYNILDYRKRFTQMASEAINKGSLADVNRLAKEFSKWSEANKNPLEPFATKFNPVLSRLNLEIDLINTEYSIPLKRKEKDEVIPIQGLSTGTKGLLLSMFLLWELDTQDAIVLVDEPERSLFPDMQIDLIGHYRRFAPESQIIVATHSPFIAAAFEPEERFILYFDKQGEVNVRRGESPIGDDPNDMLKNDFNVSYYNEFGKQAYQEYLGLKAKVIQEKDEKRKNDLVIKMVELGDKYNF